MNQQVQKIVEVYEQRMGMVAPIIVTNIQRALESYPFPWVMRAVETAEPRRWGEVMRLLSQWQKDGHPPDDTATAVVSGEWADLIRQVMK